MEINKYINKTSLWVDLNMWVNVWKRKDLSAAYHVGFLLCYSGGAGAAPRPGSHHVQSFSILPWLLFFSVLVIFCEHSQQGQR